MKKSFSVCITVAGIRKNPKIYAQKEPTSNEYNSEMCSVVVFPLCIKACYNSAVITTLTLYIFTVIHPESYDQ